MLSVSTLILSYLGTAHYLSVGGGGGGGKISVFMSRKCQFRVKSRDSRTFSRNSREK